MLAAVEEAANRRAWGQTEELLASLHDQVNALYVAFLNANTDPKLRRKLPKPKRFPRPGDKTSKSGKRIVRPHELLLRR